MICMGIKRGPYMQSLCVKKLGTTTVFCLLATLNAMTHTMDSFLHFTMPTIDKKTFMLGALVATNVFFLGISSCVMRSLYKANREQSKRIEGFEKRDAKFLEESKAIAQELVGINGDLKELAAVYTELEQKKTMLLKQLIKTAKDQAVINQDQAAMNKTLQSVQQEMKQENAAVLEELIKTAQNQALVNHNQANINRTQVITNQRLQKQDANQQQKLREHRRVLRTIIKECLPPPPGTKEPTNAEM
jgi:septal ring factor EnvC (AmiA/AmiB activator)